MFDAIPTLTDTGGSLDNQRPTGKVDVKGLSRQTGAGSKQRRLPDRVGGRATGRGNRMLRGETCREDAVVKRGRTVSGTGARQLRMRKEAEGKKRGEGTGEGMRDGGRGYGRGLRKSNRYTKKMWLSVEKGGRVFERPGP